MKKSVITVVCLAAISLSACSTMTRGTEEAFVIETTPSGAKAELSNGLSCTTPCSLKVKRKDGFQIKITKKGYKPVETMIVSQTASAGAAGMAGNIFLGGLIGAAVDAGTGATKELKPNPLHVVLEPTG